MKFAIVGCGGVGGYFGGRLAQAGEEVVFIARGAHLEAIRAQGLRVESIAGDFTIHPAQATDDPAAIGVVDCVIVAVKAWDVKGAAEKMKPMIGSHTIVLPLENGVDAPPEIAAAVGADHVVGGLCRISAFIGGPGVIRHVGVSPYIAFGEMNQRVGDRIEALRAVFAKCTGLTADVPADINVALWEKFIFIAAISGVGAVTRQPVGGFRSVAASRTMLIRAIDETIAVGCALGVALDQTVRERVLAIIDNAPGGLVASMQKSIMDGVPSELESQNGAVVRLGRQAGVPTPTHEFLYASLLPNELKARSG